jgi:hypothetical protein
MKYLFLFEGFKEDILKEKEEMVSRWSKEEEEMKSRWSKEKSNLLEESKFQVDQVMYEITDDYSYKLTEDDYCEFRGDSIYIVYFLKSSVDDLDDFLVKLDLVRGKVKSNFGLDMSLISKHFSVNHGEFLLNFGFKSSYEEVVGWIKRYYKGLNDDLKRDVTHFKFEVIFS